MVKFVELCEELFLTKDFYEILGVSKTASDKEIKKAYHKVSLLVHPDRVPEKDKVEATEKFKVLGKIHSILSDKEKRAVYDETGSFDEDDATTFNWINYWRILFKEITVEDIRNHEKDYIGSELERKDIQRAYLGGKGCLNHIHSHVPFMNWENEPRLVAIINGMIASGEVPEFDKFTQEPEKKRKQRQAKYRREAAEVHDLDALTEAMRRNREKRGQMFGDLIASIETKAKRKSIKAPEETTNGRRKAQKRRTK